MEKRVVQKVVLAILVFLLSPSVVSATTYYVRADGSNGNTGLANIAGGAWLTIDFAAGQVSAGDVVRVRAGSYAERVTPNVNGTSTSAMVTFVADGSATVCGWDFSNNSYIRIIGFVIDTDSACAENNGAVVFAGTNTYLEVWNNTIRDAHFSGVRIGLTDRIHNSLIIANYFENFGIGVGNGSGMAIAIRGNNNLIAYNEINNSHPDGFLMDGNYNRWINNYTHNLSEASGGHSDVFQAGSSTLGLSHNLIEATFQVAIGNSGDEHSAQISHGQSANCAARVCGAMTENVFRRNVWHNVSAGTIGINQSLDGPINVHAGLPQFYGAGATELSVHALRARVDRGSDVEQLRAQRTLLRGVGHVVRHQSRSVLHRRRRDLGLQSRV